MTSGRFGATFRQVETLLRFGPVAHLSDGQLLERFVDRRDGGEAAFEALVARHGAMVLGVCRRVLGSAEGAEDAFQATFLVLVRQAGAIRNRESLGPWLHGVARRVSMRARRDAARRRERERVGFKVVGGDAPDESLAATLHDEIARLPEKYRTPIVLCDLEGRSHAEAARSLDWPIGTVSGRLSRARALLRTRMTRRGVALSTAGLASVLMRASEARARVAPSLVSRAVRTASDGVAGMPSAPGIAAMTRGVVRPWLAPAWKVAAGLIASTGIGLGTGRGGVERSSPVEEAMARPAQAARPIAQAAPESSATRRQIEDEREIVAFALAPDGLTLASGDLAARVTLWDLQTGLEVATFRGHTAPVRQVVFTRDGQMLASASDDHTIRVWDLASRREALTVTMLEPGEARPMDHGPESASADSGRGAPGRDCSADSPVREADMTSGA